MTVYDIAAVAVSVVAIVGCLVMLVLSWRLERDAQRHVAHAQRILTRAQALLERSEHPLRMIEGGKR